MKTKTLLCALAAGAMTFAVSKASALPYMPSPKINISGTVIYQGPTSDNGTVSKGMLKTVSFNNKTLIELLNASPTFQAALTNQFGSVTSNAVPAGSYFIWDMYDEELIITNKNGFSFNLDSNLSGDDFGYLDFDYDVLIGSFSINDTTGAGSELDQTGVEFYFDDANGNDLDPEYGNGTFHWSYGPVTTGQKATVSVNLSPAGYYASVGGTNGITKNFHISGSGTATISGFGEPFYKWW